MKGESNMRKSDKLRLKAFGAGGLATLAIIIALATFAPPQRWSEPVLWMVLFFVWVVISAWFFKIDLDREAKETIVNKF